MYLVHFILSFI